MTAAITTENLGKCYRVCHQHGRAGYKTLRESIYELAGATWDRVRGRNRSETTEEFWALRDLNIEIQPGEVVGIIGRNGAGKSTLLKILSRITPPSTGRALIQGRIGSLLEVGTGFHPELTGRENVYLNGSILGMSRREIVRRFDEIVSFSEIAEFLDTPVKRYSSGMYVRLAFAVAAHLDPEILLLDEVLAVGDATYQKRCIDRMRQIASSGRSVILVSHNMDLIPRLCKRAILLDRGQVSATGPAGTIVRQYLEDASGRCVDEDLSRKSRVGDGRALFTHLCLIGPDGQPRLNHPSGEDLIIRVRIQSQKRISNAALAVNVATVTGTRIHSGWTREVGFPLSLDRGTQEYQCHFRKVRLRPGRHMTIGLWLEAGSVVDSLEEAMTFEVIEGHGAEHLSTDRHQGVVLCDYEWSELSGIPRDTERHKSSIERNN